MGLVFADKEGKQLTDRAALFVWFVLFPILIVSSLLNQTALIIWGVLLATVAVVGTFMGR